MRTAEVLDPQYPQSRHSNDSVLYWVELKWQWHSSTNLIPLLSFSLTQVEYLQRCRERSCYFCHLFKEKVCNPTFVLDFLVLNFLDPLRACLHDSNIKTEICNFHCYSIIKLTKALSVRPLLALPNSFVFHFWRFFGFEKKVFLFARKWSLFTNHYTYAVQVLVCSIVIVDTYTFLSTLSFCY